MTADAMNGTLALLMGRRSVRAYEERPVPAEMKEAILDAAMRSPTAGNQMLYSVIDVTDNALKERLSHSCDEQPFIAAAPLVLVFLADYQRWMDLYGASGALAGGGVRPAEADLLLCFSDALIAAQSAAVAAESLGLGSCYIGDIMERYEEHRELFGLPPLAFPAAMLCIGWPTERQRSRPQTPRFPAAHIVFENAYRRETPETLEILFAGRQQGPLLPGAANYGQHEYLRKFSSPFMEEMRRSVRAALDNWR